MIHFIFLHYFIPIPDVGNFYHSDNLFLLWIDEEQGLKGVHLFGLGRPAPLEIKPLPEWEEPCTPVRSPVTRSFARE